MGNQESSDATGELNCALDFYGYTGTVTFDLIRGTLSVLADAPDPTIGGITVQGDVSDTYALVGRSDPDAVHHFQAVFTVKMVYGMEAYVRRGTEEGALVDTIRCQSYGCDTTTVVYDLFERVGEPFTVTFGMTGWDDWIYTSHGTMTISFTGLEDGLSVGSCHGYHGLTAPVAHTTWGRIKARYR